MVNIAIVEDNENDRQAIAGFIKKYGEENGLSFNVVEFENAITFITNYNPSYDLVFMDIEMPHMDGMEGAAKLREVDFDVPLVFITNMSNYAVKGYSVAAVDFLVKPVVYPCFSAMMAKVMRIIGNREQTIMLKNADGRFKVRLNSVYYIESYGHQICYHADNGDFTVWGTMKEQEQKLPAESFCRCSNFCIVNLRYVDESTPDGNIIVNGKTISVSRARRKEFSQKLLTFYSKYV